jgi:hypothetical protein
MPNANNLSFNISVRTLGRRYLLTVERTYVGDSVERFRIYPRSNPDKYIEVENNRPMIRLKHQLKNKRYQWKVKIGSPHNITAFNEVIEQIERYLEPPEGRGVHPKNM